jgi:hypothetical protein
VEEDLSIALAKLKEEGVVEEVYKLSAVNSVEASKILDEIVKLSILMGGGGERFNRVG